MPYLSGRALLRKVTEKWPDEIVIRLHRANERPAPKEFRVANGTVGVSVVQGDEIKVKAGKMDGGLELNRPWREGFLNGGEPESPVKVDGVQATTTDDAVEIVMPKIMTEGNPGFICFEWGRDGQVR
jgi:hypothetical protein